MDEFEMAFDEPDLVTNTRKVTLKVPADVDPMVAKKMLRNALSDPVAIEGLRTELIKIGEESK
ncbi:MAG: hypothetical protein HXK47_05105 [Atopobium sp.]|nr:hypothetical protein [Atopobium sp.]